MKTAAHAESVSEQNDELAELRAINSELLSVLIDVRANVQGDSPAMWARVDAIIAKAGGNDPRSI